MSFPYLGDAVKAYTGLDIPLPLPMFGLCLALAMLIATEFFRRELQRQRELGQLAGAWQRADASHSRQILDGFVSNFAFVVLISGIVGARLFHILEHVDAFMANPLPMIFSRSGLSIMGGLIGGALAGIIMVRRTGLPIRPVLDAIAPVLMLGYGLGRIGCQISGDGDWGITANLSAKPDALPLWLWAQTYENNIYGAVIAQPGVYPTPIYETLMALILFGLLRRWRTHTFQRGWLFALYLVMAGAERLLIEQIRVNPVLHVGAYAFTQAELIAGLFVLIGTVGLAFLSRRRSTPC